MAGFALEEAKAETFALSTDGLINEKQSVQRAPIGSEWCMNTFEKWHRPRNK